MSTAFKSRLIAGGFLCSSVLMGCVSQSKYQALEAENAQLQQQVAAQQSQLGTSEGKITRLQGAVKHTIEADLLFPSGSWEMSDDGKQILGRMAQKLAPTQENKLVVHGYTDNTPVGPELERQGVTSNTTLSQKRADAVRVFLIQRGLDPNLITAVGHGESNPVAENDTSRGRSQNRRVELNLGG
ncbi:MAG: hypothetical protein JWP01_2386 [Myxococcales bacterium]|nr:hypothetical protein [Myxococcales bacterium]